MSRSEQGTLEQFATADADAEVDTRERPTFEGARYTGGHAEPERERSEPERGVCERCGAFVGQAFARVLGDNDGRIHACPECTESWSDLRYEANDREHPEYQVPWEVFDG